jgi:hypothetical protein
MPTLKPVTFGSDGKMNRTLTAFLAVACGVSGLYLVSNPKSGVLSLSKVGGRSLDKSKKLYSETIWENKEAEIIGDYLSHGVGGTTFRLPSGDVLKIVSLEKDDMGFEGQPNREQAEFIEDLWRQQLSGKRPFTSDFVEIKHYNRGHAGLKMAQLVSSESNVHPLKMGEKIAYWVMEYVPTIGQGTMSDARVKGAKQRLEDWAESKGYTLDDMHEDNFGQRENGSFVLFDGWPTKIEQ